VWRDRVFNPSRRPVLPTRLELRSSRIAIKGTDRPHPRLGQNRRSWRDRTPQINGPAQPGNGQDFTKGRAKDLTKTASRKASPRRWSQRVTTESDALDLKRGLFKLTDPKKIAASLKRSAQHSSRRKAGAYRSALSMLTFYINRAGKSLPKTQRARLERAKMELKRQFGKEK
jgi:Protein of unknown function (DUF3175)